MGAPERGEILLQEVFHQLRDDVQGLLVDTLIRDYLERAGYKLHRPNRNIVPVLRTLQHAGQSALPFRHQKFRKAPDQTLNEIERRRKQGHDVIEVLVTSLAEHLLEAVPKSGIARPGRCKGDQWLQVRNIRILTENISSNARHCSALA